MKVWGKACRVFEHDLRSFTLAFVALGTGSGAGHAGISQNSSESLVSIKDWRA